MTHPDPEGLTTAEWLRAGTRHEQRLPHIEPADLDDTARIVIGRLIYQQHPKLDEEIVSQLADGWSRVGIPLHDVVVWLDALGIAGFSNAADCRARGLRAGHLGTAVVGVTLGARLRRGETVDEVLALASPGLFRR